MKRETHIYFIFSAHVAALFALMILKNIKYFLHKAKIQCSVSCLFSLYQYITYIYDDDEPIHVQTKKFLGCSKAIFMYCTPSYPSQVLSHANIIVFACFDTCLAFLKYIRYILFNFFYSLFIFRR